VYFLQKPMRHLYERFHSTFRERFKPMKNKPYFFRSPSPFFRQGVRLPPRYANVHFVDNSIRQLALCASCVVLGVYCGGPPGQMHPNFHHPRKLQQWTHQYRKEYSLAGGGSGRTFPLIMGSPRLTDPAHLEIFTQASVLSDTFLFAI
jgi:hypothetical protein